MSETLRKETATAMHEPPRIKSVHVLSSGTAEQHKEHRYGSPLPQFWWVLTSHSWIPIPIHYFLIEHRDGLILFDTGLDPAIVINPRYIDSAIGRMLLRRIFRLHITEMDRLDRVLARPGFAAEDVQTAVISHLHFDHVGGIAQIPQAELLVSAREWELLSLPHPDREWIFREHIRIPGSRWHPVQFEPSIDPLFEGFDGISDVTGDGSLILLPTPGHTPGSLSLLIRRAGWAPILLVADVAYDAGQIASGKVPGTGDAGQLGATYAKIRALNARLPDLVVVASHDPAASQLIEGAMQPSSDQGLRAE